MLRTAILLVAIPLANALSLANFQDIRSIWIPLTCQFVYDQQIPDCVMSDFGDDGCSTECQQTLTSLANSVSFACSNVNANSRTLLGIIQDGKILKALCPTVRKVTSSAVQTTDAQTTAPPAVVTIPTASPGVIVDTSALPAPVKTTQSHIFTTSTTVQMSTIQTPRTSVQMSTIQTPSTSVQMSTIQTPSTSVQVSKTQTPSTTVLMSTTQASSTTVLMSTTQLSSSTAVSSTVESTQTSDTATTSQTTVQPPSSTSTSSEAVTSTAIWSTISSLTRSSSARSSSATSNSAISSSATNTKPASDAATQKATVQAEGGGGSPFDISSNSGCRLASGPILAVFVAACTGIFLGQ